MQYNKGNAVRADAMHYNITQNATIYCNALHYIAIEYKIMQRSII